MLKNLAVHVLIFSLLHLDGATLRCHRTARRMMSRNAAVALGAAAFAVINVVVVIGVTMKRGK